MQTLEIEPLPQGGYKGSGKIGKQQARNIVEACERRKHLNLLGVRETFKKRQFLDCFKEKVRSLSTGKCERHRE